MPSLRPCRCMCAAIRRNDDVRECVHESQPRIPCLGVEACMTQQRCLPVACPPRVPSFRVPIIEPSLMKWPGTRHAVSVTQASSRATAGRC
jgi:hypothetical protein